MKQQMAAVLQQSADDIVTPGEMALIDVGDGDVELVQFPPPGEHAPPGKRHRLDFVSFLFFLFSFFKSGTSLLNSEYSL